MQKDHVAENDSTFMDFFMSDTKTCIILGGMWNTKNLDPIPLYWLVNRDFPYWAIRTHTATFSRG